MANVKVVGVADINRVGVFILGVLPQPRPANPKAVAPPPTSRPALLAVPLYNIILLSQLKPDTPIFIIPLDI